jgi:hypothetical protein
LWPGGHSRNQWPCRDRGQSGPERRGALNVAVRTWRYSTGCQIGGGGEPFRKLLQRGICRT